jgi:WD40 repeat protein
MHTLQGHRHAIRALAFDPHDPHLLASVGDDRAVHLWDPVARQELATLPAQRDGLLAVDVAPGGGLLVTGGRGGTLTVWDVVRGCRLARIVFPEGPVTHAGFTADGSAIFAALRSERYGAGEQRLVCWRVRPWREPGRLAWEGDVEAAEFSPDGKLAAVAGPHRGVELWEVGGPRREPAVWCAWRVRCLAFAPGEERRLAVATGPVVELWVVDPLRKVVTYAGHRADVQALSFSPDGRWLLTGGADRTVRLWEVGSGRPCGAWDWGVGRVNAVAFAPDGMTAAAGGDKSALVVWDVDES